MIIQKKHILYLLTVEAINIFLKLLLVAGCCTSMICVSTNLGTAVHVNNFFTYLCHMMYMYLHHFLHVNLQMPYQYVIVS
jgi:hypothetical protein